MYSAMYLEHSPPGVKFALSNHAGTTCVVHLLSNTTGISAVVLMQMSWSMKTKSMLGLLKGAEYLLAFVCFLSYAIGGIVIIVLAFISLRALTLLNDELEQFYSSFCYLIRPGMHRQTHENMRSINYWNF